MVTTHQTGLSQSTLHGSLFDHLIYAHIKSSITNKSIICLNFLLTLTLPIPQKVKGKEAKLLRI